MTVPVVSLAERRLEPNAAAVKYLEKLLARVRAGDVVQVACAYVLRGQWVGQGWAAGEHQTLLLGAVGMLQARLGAALVAESEDAPAPPVACPSASRDVVWELVGC